MCNDEALDMCNDVFMHDLLLELRLWTCALMNFLFDTTLDLRH
jgi:hypothetical protein